MDYDKELDATKEFKIDDLTPKDNTESLEIVVYDSNKKKNKKRRDRVKKDNIFKKLITNFKNAKTKTKVIIMVVTFVVILGLIVGLYFILNKKDDKGREKEVAPIIVKDNYRYQDGTLTILDKNEKDLGKYECTNKDENLCYVAYELTDDNFDVNRKVFEDGTVYHKRSSVYFDRYVFIFDNANADDQVLILYDLNENREVEKYLGIKSYDEYVNHVVVKNTENKYGLYEFSAEGMKVVIKEAYDYMGIVDGHNDEIVVVTNDDKWSLLDFTQKTLVNNVNDEVKEYNDKYLAIQSNSGEYSVIDYQKKTILNNTYVFVQLLSKYVILIDSNNILMVTDYANNKMTEEGFKLAGYDYVKTNVYDADGLNIETKASYAVTLSGNTMNIGIINGEAENIKGINLLEGSLSKNYKFYSYFDGKLYFYEDALKTKLIGSYVCEFANNIDSSTKDFTQCYIASDVNEDNNDMVMALNVTSVTPIYHNKYVFIRDAKSLASDSDVKIKLYDITNKKVLSSYISVNTYSIPENSDVYHESASEKVIIGKNKDRKYGAIKITATEAKGAISFSYDSLEKIGSYYVGKRNNKWVLIEKTTNTSNEVQNDSNASAELNAQIRGYNVEFIKVKNGNRYEIYNYFGQQVAGDVTDAIYIELYDTYFVTVDSARRLRFYNYAGTLVYNGTVQLESTSYYGVLKPAFTISFNENTAVVMVLRNNIYVPETYVLE